MTTSLDGFHVALTLQSDRLGGLETGLGAMGRLRSVSLFASPTEPMVLALLDLGTAGGATVELPELKRLATELQSSCGPSSQLPRFAGLQGCGGPTGFVVKGAVDVDPRRAGSPGGAQRQRAGRRM